MPMVIWISESIRGRIAGPLQKAFQFDLHQPIAALPPAQAWTSNQEVNRPWFDRGETKAARSTGRALSRSKPDQSTPDQSRRVVNRAASQVVNLVETIAATDKEKSAQGVPGHRQ